MIKIEDLTVFYGEKQVLDNINLTLKEGKLNVIIGKNGSGKTTLLKSLANQIKFRGKVFINKQNVKTLSRIQRGQTVSYLPQITSSASITVEKLVSHGRYPYMTHNRVLNDEDRKIILNAMKNTDVEHLRKQYINQLSGGERQRAFLAMILAQDTDVIILDEPCNFLDIDHQISILKIIRCLKNSGKTIVLVLHDLQQAFTIADNIILIDNGKIVMNDSTSNVVKSNVIDNVFNLKVVETNKGLYDYYLEEI